MRPEEWDAFITESFSHPELYIDLRKSQKKPRGGAITNKLKEIANRQKYFLLLTDFTN